MHNQEPELPYVWTRKGEYEVIIAELFHTLYFGFVQKAILV